MVRLRSPCCEKKGLKKGHWTPQEDQKANWRAFPKQAVLSNAAMVVIIFLLLIFTTKPLEAARSLDNMKPTFGANVNKDLKNAKVPEDRGPLPPSAPNPCSYIPKSSPGGIEHCNK